MSEHVGAAIYTFSRNFLFSVTNMQQGTNIISHALYSQMCITKYDEDSVIGESFIQKKGVPFGCF